MLVIACLVVKDALDLNQPKIFTLFIKCHVSSGFNCQVVTDG